MKYYYLNLQLLPLTIALIHFLIILFLFVNMIISNKGYGGWYIMYFIDFPISIVFQGVVRILKQLLSSSLLHQFPSHNLPLLVILQFTMYSILGSSWYYFLAYFIQKIITRIRY